jgi:Periplasmic copper-binding protein (NosD)
MRLSMLSAVAAVAALGLALVVPGGASAGGKIVFASPNGSGTSCRANAPCSLATAVASAPAGSTVKAFPGLYRGGVSFSKQLDLEGQAAVLDAATSPDGYGIEVSGPGGSGSVIAGWTVINAQFSGILVGSHIVDAAGNPLTDGSPIDDVTVDHVTVVNNDRGFSGVVGQGVGECFSTPFAPGDCGEGIHLVSATDSTVEHSLVWHNAGGILMTDEFGPASGNTISFDAALDNNDDCGITIASHTANQIYGNTIEHNVADRNGVAGQGAGILMAGAGPGTGVHDNTVSYNEASGNGLSGITIHDHFPGNFDNNVITNNRLSNNNLDGDFDFLTQDPQTTDILVAAGPPFTGPPVPAPITGTVIADNQISDAEVGIWTLNVDLAGSTIQNNHFHNITTPISNN